MTRQSRGKCKQARAGVKINLRYTVSEECFDLQSREYGHHGFLSVSELIQELLRSIAPSRRIWCPIIIIVVSIESDCFVLSVLSVLSMFPPAFVFALLFGGYILPVFPDLVLVSCMLCLLLNLVLLSALVLY